MMKDRGDGFYFLFRNVKFNKKLYLLEISIIIVVTMLFFTVSILEISKWGANLKDSCVMESGHVVFDGSFSALSDDEKNEYGIKRYFVYSQEDCFIQEEKTTVFVNVRCYDNVDSFPADLQITGDYPKNENEILLYDKVKYYIRRSVDVGDTVEILDSAGEIKEFTISGFYSYDMEEGSVITIFTCGTPKEGFVKTSVEFIGEFGIVEKTRLMAEQLNVSGYSFNEKRLAVFFQKKDGYDIFGLLKYIIGFAVMVMVSFILLKTTIDINREFVAKNVGILRALGAKKSKIYYIFLVEKFVMGVIGGVLGVILAYGLIGLGFLMSGYNLSTGRTLEMWHPGLVMILTIIFVVGLCLFSSLIFVRRNLKQTISSLLSEKRKISFQKRESRNSNNPILAYVYTTISRNKGRVILTVISISGSIALFIFFACFLNDTNKLYGIDNDNLYYDICINLNENYSQTTKTEELINQIQLFNGVEDLKIDPVYGGIYSNIDENFVPAESPAPYDTVFVDADSENAMESKVEREIYGHIRLCAYNKKELTLLNENILQGDTDLNGLECILVGETSKYEGFSGETSGVIQVTDLKVNDIIKVSNFLQPSSENGETEIDSYSSEENPLQLVIKGIVNADLYGFYVYNPVIIVSNDLFIDLIKDEKYECGGIYIKTSKSFDYDAFRDMCLKNGAFGRVSYCNPNQNIINDLAADMGSLYIEIIVTACVGIVNLFCIIMLGWEIQRKEYAILQAIGASRKTIVRVIITEKGITCFLELVLGLVAGIGLEKITARFSFGSCHIFELPYFVIGIVVLIMLLLVIIVVHIQSLLLNDMNVAETLKSAE